MGREYRVESSAVADWPALQAFLQEHQVAAQLRMIDDLPAFPDEVPDPNWRELRVSLNGQMVTIARIPDGYRVVSWGTGDPQLEQTRAWVTLAVATVTDGRVIVDGTPLDRLKFAKDHGLRP